MRPVHQPLIAFALVLTGAATAGCGDELRPPPITWEGEHLRFGTEADEAQLCAGTLSHLDGVAGYLQGVFDSSTDIIDYYWLPEGTEPFCPDGAEGCATEQGVFSRFTVHQHELVHGLRLSRLMAMPLEEGLAEAFGDDWDPSYGLEDDIRSVLREPTAHFPGSGYGRAGHFVSYLVASHGLDAVLALESTTGYDSSFDRLRDGLHGALGQDLETTLASYEANYPACDLRTYRDKGFDCSRAPGLLAPTVVGESVEHSVSLRCDDPAVIGPRFGLRWTTVSVEIAEAGRYHITATPRDLAGYELVQARRCDMSCLEYPDDVLSRSTGTSIVGGFCLEPGRYLFRFEIDERTTDGGYDVSVRRTDAPACD